MKINSFCYIDKLWDNTGTAKQWNTFTVHVIFALLCLLLTGLTGMITGFGFALGQELLSL